jgi:hypothetical protein
VGAATPLLPFIVYHIKKIIYLFISLNLLWI